MALSTEVAADAAQRSAATRPIDVVVRQLRYEADGVVSVQFQSPDGQPLPEWAPGAHIDLVFPTGIDRQYSLCGPVGERSYYQIAVRRERASRGGSEYVHVFLRPGQRVSLTGPRNNFGFRRADSYVFVAGGIGITPILPMIEQAEHWGADWELLYSGRTAASMAFANHLQDRYGPRVRTYPSDTVGRIPLTECFADPRDDTGIYACGPAPLLAGLQNAVEHWPTDSLHVERFKAAPRAPMRNDPVEVICAFSGKTVEVAADESILAAVEKAGIEVSSSCRTGICGSCETRVLDGIPDHRDEILSGSERETTDRMFICVSRAKTPQLTLDL